MQDNATKTLLITGAAKRIGGDIVKHFLQKNYNVIFTYNNSADEAKNIIKNYNKNKVLACKVDLCNLQQVEDFLNSIANKNIVPDVIINNASVFTRSNAQNFDIQNFDNNFHLHVKTPIVISSFFYNLAKKLDKKSCIINICDSNVVRRQTKYFNYLLSKKTLLEASYFMASEFAPYVKVNCILPGYIIGADDEDVNYLRNLVTKIPLQSQGSADDIVSAIEYLTSAKYITGQAIAVDGGLNLIGL